MGLEARLVGGLDDAGGNRVVAASRAKRGFRALVVALGEADSVRIAGRGGRARGGGRGLGFARHGAGRRIAVSSFIHRATPSATERMRRGASPSGGVPTALAGNGADRASCRRISSVAERASTGRPL